MQNCLGVGKHLKGFPETTESHLNIYSLKKKIFIIILKKLLQPLNLKIMTVKTLKGQ